MLLMVMAVLSSLTWALSSGSDLDDAKGYVSLHEDISRLRA
jgi:hypothetical protein